MELLKPFAVNGEREDFSVDTDPDGKVSLDRGFTQLYEMKPTEGGLFILRKIFNQMMYLVTNDAVKWKTQTFGDWNENITYPKNAVVRYTNGNVYVSKVANNTTVPTNTTNWLLYNPANGYVELTGNQTIAGAKTFSSSPIVPVPTTDFQSVPLKSTNITVNVGTGQQFTTINEALEYLSGFYPLYKKSGITATINLKAGFVMAEQVLVSGIDLGWIEIVGEDAETQIDHTKINQPFYGYGPIFGGANGAKMPLISQQFKYPTVGNGKDGIFVIGSGSSCDVVNGGVIGASGRGISVVGEAIAYILNANFSSAGTYGIYNSGAKVSVINTNARKIATDTTGDIYTIAAGITYIDPLTTGGFNITPNTVTSNGIVFK